MISILLFIWSWFVRIIITLVFLMLAIVWLFGFKKVLSVLKTWHDKSVAKRKLKKAKREYDKVHLSQTDGLPPVEDINNY